MTAGMPVQRRHGVAYVLEAIIAAFILLVFLITVAPSTTEDESVGQTVNTQTHRALQVLDMNGSLRPAVADRDVDRINQLISPYTQLPNVETALLVLNGTHRTPTFTGTYTDTFRVREETTQQTLRLWYDDATAPNVSINGNYVANHTGTPAQTYEAVDIAPHTSTGSNTVQLEAAGTATIAYSIDVHNRFETGTPPGDRTTYTTTYLVSGTNTSLQPAEVTVISWQ